MSGRARRQDERAGQPERSGRLGRRAPGDPSWTRAVRRPWTVACVVAAVVLGPAAATASALDRANAAPPLHAPRRGTHEGTVSP
ncbi:hypothetical protein [Streptomyces collinus]|uniref:hypothetical protein n=1 Tax=Streptomyces collinus TaxID=42684 RepID=UPI0033262AC0